MRRSLSSGLPERFQSPYVDKVPFVNGEDFAYLGIRDRNNSNATLFFNGAAKRKQFWLGINQRALLYFFFDSFLDSRIDSLDSFNSFLESPGRYSSCSAAAKAFSRPTMSSPGLSVSNASDSLRNSSSE